MLYRNLASMDVEESIRGNPLDAVVLLTGCDKTTPALMMGAASSTSRPSWSPAARCSTASGDGQEHRLGHGRVADARAVRAGTLELQDFLRGRSCMSRSARPPA
jgi:L-arabonate dehydrase